MKAPLVETGALACHLYCPKLEKGCALRLRPALLHIAGFGALAALASGCGSLKPKTVEPATGASVVAEPPLKSEDWMQIATAADESRLARVGLAWQSALA